MRKLDKVSQADVWQHWMAVENFSNQDFRSDIRDPLPEDLVWYLAEIEEKDISRLFIISSGDWTDISGGTFSVVDVVDRLDLKSNDPNTQRITKDIREKMNFLESGGEFDTRLVAVTNCPKLGGPFTFIEGNRRAVTLCAFKAIVGCQIFVGTSPAIKNYVWAHKSFAMKRIVNVYKFPDQSKFSRRIIPIG